MTNEQKIGLFFLVGIVLVIVAVEAIVGIGLFTKGYHLSVKYPTVEGLRTGDEVQVAGLKLGRVDAIALEPDGVRVSLRLAEQAIVHRDSVARLDYQALSGTRFIAISLGTPHAPVLKDGDTIEGQVSPGITQMVDDLQDVAHSVQSLADSLNENQDRVMKNVSALIEENRAALQNTIANLDSITAKLDQGHGTMAKLLVDASLYDRADTMMRDLQTVSNRLANGQGDLGRLLSSDSGLYDDARETLASLNAAARNLEDISARIRNGEGTLGRMLTDDALYIEAEHAMRSLDRATARIGSLVP